MAVSPISFQESDISMEDLLNSVEVGITDIRPGTIINGEVVGFHPEVNPESVIVAMGTKSEGKIYLKEFTEAPKKGSEIEAIVKTIDKDTGLFLLSKRELEQRKGWEIVQEAFEKEVPVDGIVESKIKQGYLVNIEGLSMFLPHSQMGQFWSSENKRSDIAGEYVTCKILELNHKRKTGIVSRRAYQEEQNDQLWQDLLGKIKIGDIVEGKVTKHIKTGAFVKIENIEGFLHKSNISWERHADDFKSKIPVESDLKVRILEIDPENHRLSLGLKQLTNDPWESVMEKFEIGDKVKGEISFVANYGAFIELGKGLEGLLHVSEMSWTRKVNHAREIVKLGDEIEAQIIGINPENKRISLGLRQLQKNPWDLVRDTIKIGDVLKGKVKKTAAFGLFVSVTNDIDALIRKEDLSWDEPVPEPKNLYKKGEEVEFKIIELNLEERKIGASIRHILPNPYKELRRKFPRGTVVDGTVTGIVEFGIFVRIDEKYEGLVHLSAMTKDQETSIKKTFKKGDKIRVVIKSIDHEKRKISLSTRDVDYALEKMEMAQYIEKESRSQTLTSSPFESLKSMVSSKEK
ncbi:MAG: 30S ribosomal protein S1 [Spirochaetia bacterium]|nr:30S ribosomal protein S1 [Spirochaetia bacterium]